MKKEQKQEWDANTLEDENYGINLTSITPLNIPLIGIRSKMYLRSKEKIYIYINYILVSVTYMYAYMYITCYTHGLETEVYPE